MQRRINAPETLTHSDYELQYDQPWSQDSLKGGAGQLEFTSKSDEENYLWSSGIVTHTDGRTYLAKATTTLALTSGAAAFTCAATFLTSGGTRYDFCVQGPRLYRRDATSSSNTWAIVYTANVNITDIKIVDGAMLIAVPTRLDATAPANTDYYIQSDPTAAATWTPTAAAMTAMSDALGKPTYFLQIRGTTYAFVQNRRVLYNVDPTADSWVGPIDTTLNINGASQVSGPPGDKSYPFIGVKAMNNYLLAFKKDAAYTIDANQEVREAIWEWKNNPANRNFAHQTTLDGICYYSVAPEVYAYDPVTGRNLPIHLSDQAGFSVEDILGLSADNGFLYVLAKVRVPNVRSGASAALLRVQRVSAQQWVWEILWEDTVSTAYTGLAAVPNGNGTNVYIFTTDGTNSYLMYLPPDYDESTTGGFAASGALYMSIWRTGFPNFTKKWGWIAVDSENTSASNTLAIAYSTDLGANFTTLSTLTASGLQFVDMSGINSQSIVLRFTFVSANGSVSPVLRVFDLHGRVRFRYLRQVKAAVRVADYIETLSGSNSTDTAAVLKTNIETLRTTNSTITYKDFLGNSFTCSVDVAGYKPTRHEKPTDQYEMEAMLQISELGKGS